MKVFNRKQWLCLLICGCLACCIVDAIFIEPHWIKVNRLSLGERPSFRVVHISDIHYKGDRSYLMRIVALVNQLKPDAVCFTGDIVEDTRYLDEALNILAQISGPLYGVPGNHEYWSGASFQRIGKAFRKTGGEWLLDRSTVAGKGRVLIAGRTGAEINTRQAVSESAMPGHETGGNRVPPAVPVAVTSRHTSGELLLENGRPALAAPDAKRILLTHYPLDIENVKGSRFDLILSGHSHGGQVRLPFIGALTVPFGVNGYQRGVYQTPAGLLHVSAGLGTFFLPIRFLCQPEITLIEL
ncbi:MAG: metallophosphoesterase [Chlorobiaceae bacterium]